MKPKQPVIQQIEVTYDNGSTDTLTRYLPVLCLVLSSEALYEWMGALVGRVFG